MNTPNNAAAMTKIERARSLLKQAREAGHVPTLEGDWVVFRPRLPTDLLMEAGNLGNELAKAIAEESGS